MNTLAIYLSDQQALVSISATASGRLAWLRPGTVRAVCQAAVYAVPSLAANERITFAMPAWLSNWQGSSQGGKSREPMTASSEVRMMLLHMVDRAD